MARRHPLHTNRNASAIHVPSVAERWRSAARDQQIIHTAGFYRESAALCCSAVGGCDAKNDIKTAHAAFDAPRSGKKTEATIAAPARMSMPPHAHEGRTTPVDIRIETAIATTNEKVRAVDFITSFLFMLV
jgi:hypothetical protein